jgi:hypothetical protein
MAAPSGAAIATRSPEDGEWSDGTRTFELPDLDPGEIGTFEFTVRLIDADGDVVVLTPEIAVENMGYLDRSDPIELSVVH